MAGPFRIALLVGCGFVAMAVESPAQIYKWVDERGVTHYTERPPATNRSKPAKKLDIELQGNDLPASAQECNTIRCQYERLRKDRLLREAERREEDEARTAAIAAAKPAPLPGTPTGVATGWIDPGVPIYHRPIVVRPFPTPLPTPLPTPEPAAGGSRTPAGIGVR